MIAEFLQFNLSKSYTYTNYLTWRFMDRLELIWGKVRKMTPASPTKPQKVLGEIYIDIAQQLKGESCQVFIDRSIGCTSAD